MSPDEVRAWRLMRGLSQRRVMEIAGNPSPTAWRAWASWESGDRPVPWYLPAVMKDVDEQVS